LVTLTADPDDRRWRVVARPDRRPRRREAVDRLMAAGLRDRTHASRALHGAIEGRRWTAG